MSNNLNLINEYNVYNTKVTDLNGEVKITFSEIANSYLTKGNHDKNRSSYDNLTPEEIEANRQRAREHQLKQQSINIEETAELTATKFRKYAPKFITLTYSDANHRGTTDVQQANKEFGRFIQEVNRVYDLKIEFIKALEFTKQGRVHFHALVYDMKFIAAKELEAIWGKGFIKIESVKDLHLKSIRDVAKYIAKYITKANTERPEECKGQRMYSISQGVRRPRKHRINHDLTDPVHCGFIKELKSIAERSEDGAVFQQVNYRKLMSEGVEEYGEVIQLRLSTEDYKNLCKKHGVITWAPNTIKQNIDKSRRLYNEAISQAAALLNITQLEREAEWRI